jgi:hypothetical protein
MSETAEHFIKSLERVEKRYPEIYQQEKDLLIEILINIHEWLDDYSAKEGEDEEGKYDFTNPRVEIRHRARRHHIEGINEIVGHITCLYGDRFAHLARQEAEKHVIDDMKELLSRDECHQRLYWRSYGN